MDNYWKRSMKWEDGMVVWNRLPEGSAKILQRVALQRLIEQGAEKIDAQDVNSSIFELISSGEYLKFIYR